MSAPADKPYHRDIDRIRALYRIPPAPEGRRTLEVFTGERARLEAARGAACRIRGPGEPEPATAAGIAVPTVEAGQPLPFDDGSFDLAVLHETLDALATRAGARGFPAVRDRLLGELCRVLAPGGVIAGAAANASLARRLLPEARRGAGGAGLSLRTTERLLRGLGLVEVRVFTLIPDAASPLRLVEVHDEVAHAFFSGEVRRQRALLPWWGYLVRDLLVRTRVYADLQPSLFFWGRRP